MMSKLIIKVVRIAYDLLQKIFHSGLHFWDYGNAFLLEARRAGADVTKKNADGQQDDNSIEFRYDSYVQKIMGYERMKEFLSLQ